MDEQKHESESKPQSNPYGLLIIIAVLVIAGAGLTMTSLNKKTPATKQSMTGESPTGTAAMTAKSSYKDGTYSADGAYISPGGDESIGVKLTIKDGVITDAEVTQNATRPNSVRYQKIFADNYKPMVVGQKIADLHLTKVSGSSLTPKGFNDALEKIKSQAKA